MTFNGSGTFNRPVSDYVFDTVISETDMNTEMDGIATGLSTCIAKDGQTTVYYFNGRSREEIEHGPYMETFRKRDIEVLYLFEPVDDFVMTSLMEFEGKKLVSADSADIEFPMTETGDREEEKPSLSPDEIKGLAAWMKDTRRPGYVLSLPCQS